MAPSFYGCAIGDSFTHAVDAPQPKPQWYPSRVEAALQERGFPIIFSNHGISGNTTAQILTRARLLAPRRAPGLAIIYAGCNDWNRLTAVVETPAPTATSFKVEPTKGYCYLPGTTVCVGKQKGIVRTNTDDLITLADPLDVPPSPGERVIQDTVQNMVETAAQLRIRGYDYVLVGRQHYYNFTKFGDSLERPLPIAQEVRAAQTATANRIGAPIADFFNFMRDRVITGKDPVGSASWHFKDGDTHLNDYGQSLLAECVLATIPEEWLSRLAA